MTDNPDLHCGRGWLARASDVLTGAEDYLSAVEYAHAAAVIGNGYVNLAHATQALEAMDQASEVDTRQLVAFDAIADAADRTDVVDIAAVAQRQARAETEARPHDGEPVPGDVIKCQQCGQQTRSISRGCSVCGLGMARLDEPGKDAGHVWMPYPDEPGRRCACSIGHDHDGDPDDGPDQAQETRAAADWPAESVDDRYDERAVDRG